MAPRTLGRVSGRLAIEAENLVKHSGETIAVDGVSLSVPEGPGDPRVPASDPGLT